MRTTPLLTLLLLGCSGSPVGPSLHWHRQLDAAQARWEEANIEDYSLTYLKSCFCPQVHLQVTVEDGVIVAIHDLVADTAFTAPFPDYTVPGLFDAIGEALRRGPAEFTGVYDAVHGAPVSAAFDPIANAVDDEWGFSVQLLQPR